MLSFHNPILLFQCNTFVKYYTHVKKNNSDYLVNNSKIITQHFRFTKIVLHCSSSPHSK